MGNRRKKRRVPLGKPLPEATEETVVYTPEEIERARQAWLKASPEQWRDLLDAEIEPGDEFD